MSRVATSGSAAGRGVRRSQGGLSIPPGRCQAPSKSHLSTRSQHLRRCLAPPCGTRMRGWQPAGGSGCGRGRVRRPCPILYAGSEALRPPAGDGWSPRPPAASNLGERLREMAASKSRGSFHTPGPVPGTVEIASEHEIATSAAVPGTVESGTEHEVHILRRCPAPTCSGLRYPRAWETPTCLM